MVGPVVSMALALAGAPAAFAAPLVGTFHITAGADSGGGVVGSYFRMILSGGTTSGPYISNGSSSAADQTYTFLSPGTDGGLVTGSYQPEPVPAFDGTGNSLAVRIIAPTPFFGVAFSADTAAVDPQTAASVAAPSVSDDGAGHLTGDFRAWGASWNGSEFNQGSPKPDGSHPGLTAGPTGTYDSGTGHFTLEWTSLIVGGPFNGFTGKWHFEGTFVPAATTTTTATTSTSLAPTTSTTLATTSTSLAPTTSTTSTSSLPPTTTTTASTTTTTTSTVPTVVATRVAGKVLSLTDNASKPAKRSLTVVANDLAIGLGGGNGSADDPTGVGATVRVVGATFDDTYTLAAGQWALVGPAGANKGYKYKNPLGPFHAALLKPGKPGKPGSLKLAAKGAGLAYTLASNPAPVSIVATIGGQRFWAQFGGTTTFKAGKSFKAKNAPAPTGVAP